MRSMIAWGHPRARPSKLHGRACRLRSERGHSAIILRSVAMLLQADSGAAANNVVIRSVLSGSAGNVDGPSIPSGPCSLGLDHEPIMLSVAARMIE